MASNTLQPTIDNLMPRPVGEKTLRFFLVKYKAFLIVSALMACAAAFSFFFLFSQSLRLDESQSLWQSSQTPLRILNIIAQDVHVPLYGLMLHFWEFFFGQKVAAARMLSLIFFLASIPTMYVLARKALNAQTALYSTILLTLSPFLNWYGSETRMYSLLTFMTILNQYFFISIFKNKGEIKKSTDISPWFWYGLTAAIGIYVHYFFWFVLLTQGVFYLLYRSSFPKNTFKNFVVLLMVLIVLIAPWLWYVKHLGLASNSQPLLIKPTSVNLFNTFSQFIFGFQDDHLNTILVSLWPLSVLFGFLALRKRIKIPLEVIYFFIAAVLPIILAFIVSVTFKPVFVSRYLILATPALYIFLSWFLSLYSKPLSITLKSAVVVIMILTLGRQVYAADTPVKENYQQAAIYISAHATPRDVIVVSAPFTIYPFEYYYNGQTALTTLPIWDQSAKGSIPPFIESKLPQEIAYIKADHQKIWILFSYDQGYQKNIKDYFDTHFERVDQREFSTGMELDAYKLRYDTPNAQ